MFGSLGELLKNTGNQAPPPEIKLVWEYSLGTGIFLKAPQEILVYSHG